MASGPPRGPKGPGSVGRARPGSGRAQSIVVGPVTTTAGAAISGATVYLHDVATGARLLTGTTNASGSCTFYVNNAGVYFWIAFKAGSPNVVVMSDLNVYAT